MTGRRIIRRKLIPWRDRPPSHQAAHWYMLDHAHRTREQAARRYGVTVAAVGWALRQCYHPDLIPDRRRISPDQNR